MVTHLSYVMQAEALWYVLGHSLQEFLRMKFDSDAYKVPQDLITYSIAGMNPLRLSQVVETTGTTV